MFSLALVIIGKDFFHILTRSLALWMLPVLKRIDPGVAIYKDAANAKILMCLNCAQVLKDVEVEEVELVVFNHLDAAFTTCDGVYLTKETV